MASREVAKRVTEPIITHKFPKAQPLKGWEWYKMATP